MRRDHPRDRGGGSLTGTAIPAVFQSIPRGNTGKPTWKTGLRDRSCGRI